MTELNINNIATASETFIKPVQPVLTHQVFVSVNVIDENVHQYILGLSTLALLYRIGSCRNEKTINNENAFKLEKNHHDIQYR
jgi:hypothetical protein